MVAPRDGEAFASGDESNDLLRAEPNVAWASPDKEFGCLLADAAVFLDTSLIEGLHRRLIDACVAGVPVVAPDLGAVRELIDNETGYLVEDFHRPEAYASCLRELLSEPEKARKRAKKARLRVKKEFTWPRFVAGLRSIDGYL